MTTKEELRREIRARLALLSEDERRAASSRICGALLRSDRWRESRSVLLYHPLPDEVDVRPLLQAALDEGKQVLLPRVEGADLQIVPYDGRLRRGAFGILEPVGEGISDLSQTDLVLVPGRAFDAEGRRLGRGRGYYDRLLPRLAAWRIGVCFPCQIIGQLSCEPHDIAMDEVCSL